jgi:hypothetical protein
MIFAKRRIVFARIDSAQRYGVDSEDEISKKEMDRSRERSGDRMELLSPDELRCLNEWLDSDQQRWGD